MAVNNRIITKSMPRTEITDETISEIWDFFEEAFTGFENVTFERNTDDMAMYIYLDKNKKMYMKIYIPEEGKGAVIEYWLGDKKCTSASYGNSSAATHYYAYIRTAYGVGWAVSGQNNFTSESFDYINNFFTLKNTPTLFVEVAATYYILSSLHDVIEKRADGTEYLSTALAEQRFAVANAYSCDKVLNLRHLFRVLGIPIVSYPKGNILVGTKKLIWFNRYALEYEEES